MDREERKQRRALRRELRRELISLRLEHSDLSADEFQTLAKSTIASEYREDLEDSGADIDTILPLILKIITELLPIILKLLA